MTTPHSARSDTDHLDGDVVVDRVGEIAVESIFAALEIAGRIDVVTIATGGV